MAQALTCFSNFSLFWLALNSGGVRWRQAAAQKAAEQQRAVAPSVAEERVAPRVERAAAGGPPLGEQELLAVRQPIAEAMLASAPAMPGAEALVRRCVALGIPMALATSSARSAVEVKVAPHPWMALISERVHGDDPELGDGKPAPDTFLLAARRLGVAPTACWAFEDSSAGVAAALGAGCLVHVLLPPGVGCQAYPEGVVCLNSLEEVRLDQ